MSLRSPFSTAALGLVAALWTFAVPSDGAVITQTATDTGSQTSWTEGARWSDGQPPSAGNDYLTPAPYWFRTPGTSDVQPFAGDSLTIQGTLILRHVGSATIDDLRLDGGGMLHGIANRTITLAGNISLMQTAVMDPHLADRTIVLESTISGVGGLTLAPGTIVTSTAPNGTLVLTAANTYTGPTTIEGGTLTVSGAGRIQDTSEIVVQQGGTFRYAPSAAHTFNRPIAGEGTIRVQYGAGGNFYVNSSLADFDGDVVFESGSGWIRPNANFSSGSAAFHLAAGSNVNLNGDLVWGEFSGATGALLGSSGGSARTLTFGHLNTDAVYSGTVNNVPISFVKEGTGTQTFTQNLSRSNATTTINAGAIQVGNGGTTGHLGGSGIITNNASLIFNRSNDVAVANNITGTGSLTKLGAGILTLSGNNNYAGTTTVANGTLLATHTGAAAGWNTSGMISVSNGATYAVRAGGAGEWTSENIDTLLQNAAFAAGSSLGIEVIGANVFDRESPIGGGQGLTKIGTGTLVLPHANTFSGPTAVAGGTLRVAHSHALQNSTLTNGGIEFDQLVVGNAFTLGGLAGGGNITLENNASTPEPVTLSVGNSHADTFYRGVLSGPGTLTKTGSGVLTLLNANTYGGSTIVEAGTLRLGLADLGNPVGFWEMSESTGTTIYNSVAGSPDGTLLNSPAWVEGPGGAGTYGVSFNGSDQYAQIDTADTALSAIGDGPFAVSAWVKSDLSGGWYRAIVTNFGTSSIDDFWGLGWMNTNRLGFVVRDDEDPRNEVRVQADSGWGLDDEWRHLVGVRDGEGQLHLYLDGKLEFTADDTVGDASNTRNILLLALHGSTYVRAAIAGVGIWDTALDAGAVGQVYARGLAPWGGNLPETTALQIAAGGTFDLAGRHQTVASLADHNGGGGTVLLGGGTLTVAGDGIATTFSGTIDGAGGLIKTGTGTLTLTGANTYQGGTIVDAGTLLVSNTDPLQSGTGSGAVTVRSGGMLGGVGTVGGPTTVEAGGTLSPGESPGMLNFLDDLTLDIDARIRWEFNGEGEAGTDYNSITGTNLWLPSLAEYDPEQDNKLLALDIAGPGGSLIAGDSFTLFEGDVFLGETLLNPGDDITHLFRISDHSGWWGTWEVTGGSLMLTAVPEPGAWLLLMCALASGLLVRRRK